jgi:hypothetical protein
MYIFSRGFFGRLFALLREPFGLGRESSRLAGGWPSAFPATLFLPRERPAEKRLPQGNENQIIIVGPVTRLLAARLATIAKQNAPKLLVGKRAGRCGPAGKAIPKRVPRVLKSYRRMSERPRLAGETRVLPERVRSAEILEMRRETLPQPKELPARIRRAA